MPDIIDSTIESLVAAREHGMSCREAIELVHDVYAAPWSDDQPHGALAHALIDYVFSHPRPSSAVPAIQCGQVHQDYTIVGRR